MSARFDMPKVSAASVVEKAYDGVVQGAFEVLARVGDDIVAVRQGALLGTAFHPEISG